MRRQLFAPLFVFCAVAFIAPRLATATNLAVTMSWSPVGNPGNAADPLTGKGAVSYSYNIGTYDVTNAQYAAFLNSNDPAGANLLGLYNANMNNSSDAGITFTGRSPRGQFYSPVPGHENRPASAVTFFDAIRFANWMDNGQIPGSTETGAYTLIGDTPIPSNENSITRNAGATIFLPSENEWYKAAYYNSATSSYYLFPTSSNSAPTPSAPTAAPNSANYERVLGFTTNVGAYTGTTSPYGAFDMGGELFQWTENLTSPSFRELNGGEYNENSDVMESIFENSGGDFGPGAEFGFRLASVAGVPEPGTGLLAALASIGLIGLVWSRRRSASLIRRPLSAYPASVELF